MGHGCPLFNCPHFKHRRNWCLVSLSSSFKDKQSPSRFFSLSSLGKPLVRILHVQTKFGRPNSVSTPCEMRLVSFILYKHFLATAKSYCHFKHNFKIRFLQDELLRPMIFLSWHLKVQNIVGFRVNRINGQNITNALPK